ncbi:MAG: cell division protein FtsI [Candidatus Eremiobacteraeota bacterium]|nr:cell division protein FtsI [Candidatus Eremiobacteraeota bacterium]MBC5821938.1 cell division protein FtsI [Candidatus Eremiobacteraeota bacterium]
MTINRAISRLVRLFVVAYLLLFARQLYVQVIAGPHLGDNPHNPRLALLAPYRGSILARDGTILAQSSAHGRIYPLGRAFAHALGYASPRYGRSGLESVFNADLAPRPVGNDPIAQFEEVLHLRARAPALRGSTVITTIDPALEATLYGALAPYHRGAGIALDPRTGEVLALASVPSFNPARIDADFASLLNDPDSPLVDRALDGLYPPGSTFKIFTAATALSDGIATMGSTYDDPGYFTIGDFTVHDDEGEATGVRDLTGAFAASSNVDFAQIALGIGSARWYAAARKWGLGQPMGFTLPLEPDRLPRHADMTPGVLAQLGFGQADLLVTPMRMATIAATIAAGGTTQRPYLVRAVRRNGQDRPVAGPSVLATPISAAVASKVRAMMVAVVEAGTGTSAALPDVAVAGKTGTATNPAGRSHSWFVAFAPAGAPRAAVAIIVENAGYGAAVAAPIAKRVLAAALTHRT